MPRVSIIVPTHNRADFLQATLHSILAQTFDDFEILVVDDGSTDDTAARVRAFSDTRVQLIQQSQQERAVARNNGIEHARGEFLAFVDDDDVWARTFLARTLNTLQSSDAGVVYTGWNFIDARDQLLPQQAMLPNRRGEVLVDFFMDCFFPTSAALVRRDCLNHASKFDTTLVPAEDWDLWLGMASRKIKFDFVPAPLLHYRLHDQNSTRGLERAQASGRKVLDKAFARLDTADNAIKAQAYARLDFRNAVKNFGVARVEPASDFFARAVQAHPTLLEELPTYFQIICAMQPDGFKGTNEFLDLARGREYIEYALERAVATNALDPAQRARAFGNAYLVLAQLSYQRGEMRAARQYVALAVKFDASLGAQAQIWAILGKSFVPAALRARLKTWRTVRKAIPA